MLTLDVPLVGAARIGSPVSRALVHGGPSASADEGRPGGSGAESSEGLRAEPLTTFRPPGECWGVDATGPSAWAPCVADIAVQGDLDGLRAVDDVLLIRTLGQVLTQSLLIHRVAGERLKCLSEARGLAAHEAERSRRAAEETRALREQQMEDRARLDAITQELARAVNDLSDLQGLLATARQQAADHVTKAERLEEDLRLQKKKGRKLGGRLAKERCHRAEEEKRLKEEVSDLQSKLAEAREAEASAVDRYRGSDEYFQEKVAFAAPMYAEAGKGVLDRVLREYPGLDLSFLEPEGFLGAASPAGSPEAEAPSDEAPEVGPPGEVKPEVWGSIDGGPATAAAAVGAFAVEAWAPLVATASGEVPVIEVASDDDPPAESSRGGVPLGLLDESGAAPGAGPAEAPSVQMERSGELPSPGPFPTDLTSEDLPGAGGAAQDPSGTSP